MGEEGAKIKISHTVYNIHPVLPEGKTLFSPQNECAYELNIQKDKHEWKL